MKILVKRGFALLLCLVMCLSLLPAAMADNTDETEQDAAMTVTDAAETPSEEEAPSGGESPAEEPPVAENTATDAEPAETPEGIEPALEPESLIGTLEDQIAAKDALGTDRIVFDASKKDLLFYCDESAVFDLTEGAEAQTDPSVFRLPLDYEEYGFELVSLEYEKLSGEDWAPFTGTFTPGYYRIKFSIHSDLATMQFDSGMSALIQFASRSDSRTYFNDVSYCVEANEDSWSFISPRFQVFALTGATGISTIYSLDRASGTLHFTANGSSAYMASNYAFADRAETEPTELRNAPPWFSFHHLIKTVVIDEGIKNVSSYAFNGCSKLKKIFLPESIETIGEYAFGAINMDPMYVPETVTSIANRAFGYVKLTGGVTSFTTELIGPPGGAVESYCAAHSNTDFIPGGRLPTGPVWYYTTTWYWDRGTLKTLYITGSGAMPDYSAPSDAPWAAYAGELQALEISAGVTSVGKNAFNGCGQLEYVRRFDGLTSIGEQAFRGCEKLTSISLPDSLVTLGNYCFAETGLTKVTIPGKVTRIPDYAFYCCGYLTSVSLPANLQRIGDSAFLGTDIGSLTLPSQVYLIDHNAFYNCANLTKVSFNENLGSIGDSAFYGCEELNNVMLPDSLTNIGDWAFAYCIELNKLHLGSGLQTIGEAAFVGCPFKTVSIPQNVTTMGNYCLGYTDDSDGSQIADFRIFGFPGSAAQSYASSNGFTFESGGSCGNNTMFRIEDETLIIYMKDGLTSGTAMADLDSPENQPYKGLYGINRDIITSIVVESGVSRIGNYAFQEFDKVTSVTLPSSLRTIGEHAFFDLPLTSVTIPDGVTTIEDYAFSDTDVTEVTIPYTVTTIKDSAFKGCANLTRVNFKGERLKTVGPQAFDRCPLLTEVVLPTSLETISFGAFGYADYDEGEKVSGFTLICAQDGTAGEYAHSAENNMSFIHGGYLDDEHAVLWKITGSGNNQTLTITGNGAMPDYTSSTTGLNRRPWNAYKESIENVTIDGKVTAIGNYAFYSMPRLKNLRLYAPLTKIGTGAFQNCTALYYMLSMGGSSTAIGNYAFSGCTALEPSSVRLNGVASLGIKSFFDLKMTGLTKVMMIPPSVTSFDTYSVGYYDNGGSVTRDPNFKIGGLPGSEAETYANNRSIPFVVAYEPVLIQDIELGYDVSYGQEVRMTASAKGCSTRGWYYTMPGENVWDPNYEPHPITNAMSGVYVSNGTRSGGEVYSTLTIKATAEWFGREIFCRFTNDAGHTDSTHTQLSYDLQPVIKTHPVNDGGKVGDTATFTVEAEGLGTLSYQWYYSTNGGESWKESTLDGAKTDTISLGVTNARNGQQYYCVVTATDDASGTYSGNPNGEMGYAGSTVATMVKLKDLGTYTLDVSKGQNEPQENPELEYFFDAAAGTAQISKSSVYNSYGGSYSYKTTFDLDKDGYRDLMRVVDPSGNQYVRQDDYTKLTGDLTFTADEAMRHVQVQNGATQAYSKLLVKMGTPIKITKQPDSSVYAVEGETITLSVQATGDSLSYQWYLSTNGGESWKASTATGNKTDSITVKATSGRNGFKYYCLITDVNGATKEARVSQIKVVNDLGAITFDLSNGKMPVITSEQRIALENTLCAVSERSGTIGAYGGYAFDLDKDGSIDVRIGTDPELPEDYILAADDASFISGSLTVTPSHDDMIWVGEEYGNTAYSSMTFKFGNPFKVRAHSSQESGFPGMKVNISVETLGSDLSYQWMLSTDGGSSWKASTASGANTDHITVSLTAARNGYQYYCRVTDKNGVEKNSTPTELVVLQNLGAYTLDISNDQTVTITDSEIRSHIDALLSAAAAVNRISVSRSTWSDYSYYYLDEDKIIDLSAWKNSSKSEYSRYSSSLLTGEYILTVDQPMCSFLNAEAGKTAAYSSLKVVFGTPFMILRHPDDVGGFLGGTAIFSVKAQGEGLKYQWYYCADSGSTWNKATASGNKTDTLSVPVTASRNGYRYRCFITDKYGAEKTSWSGTLYVLQDLGGTTLDLSGGPITFDYGTDQHMGSIADALYFACQDGTIGGQVPVSEGDEPIYRFDLDNNGSTDLMLTNLEAGTYSFAAAETNSVSGSITLNIVVFASEDQGYSSLTVTFGAKPKITKQPTAVTAAEGETASFTVKASGEGLSYQWQYKTATGTTWGKATAEGNKTATLKVPATASRNGYSYRCVITNSLGSVTSKAVTLTVQSGPVITTQPTDKTVKLGEKASFSVTATGTDLSYLWYYKTPSGSTFVKTTSASGKTATYSVTTQAKHNGYQYYCLITDGSGNTATSDVVTLTVKTGPVITTQPTDLSVTLGEKASISVTATGTDLSYLWYYKTPSASTFVKTTSASGKTATYSITTQAKHDGYQYYCLITDGDGMTATTDIVTLTLSSAPVITKQPTAVTAAEGSNAAFTVTAAGGTLSYQWQYKTPTGSWKDSPAEGNKTATLSVPATADRNGYQYRCKVTNSSGSVTSDPATLTVQSGPTITAQPASVTASEGETVQFTVAASGTGLSYQWQYKTPTGSWKDSPAEGNKTATLTVPATTDRDGYQYRCEVTNSSGSVTSDPATLTVQTSPTITAQPVSVTANEGETVQFSISASGTGLSYQWQYKTPGGSWKNSPAEGNDTSTLSVPATASRDGYQYRCEVTNSSGSDTSDPATLTVTSGPSVTP